MNECCLVGVLNAAKSKCCGMVSWCIWYLISIENISFTDANEKEIKTFVSLNAFQSQPPSNDN